jgi:prophage DNA circulation protein
MAAARDWASTLWRSSYKGFPFWYERDDVDAGLAIVVHEFPNSDTNFNEDLGEKARYFSGNAYVTGDDADAQAAAFIQVLVSHGPGLLVVPTLGPAMVRAMPFKRTADKDRNGYIAFEVKFVREGASAAFPSVPLLQQTAFDATASLGAAIIAVAPALVQVINQPGFVADAAADQVLAVAGAIDAVRTSTPVTSAVSQAVAGDVQAIANAAAPLLDTTGASATDLSNFAAAADLSPAPPNGVKAIAAALVATTQSLASGLDAAAAQDAMASLAESFAVPAPTSTSTPSAAVAAANVSGVLQLARLAALTAWANAVIARTYTDRPSAVTARAEVAERFERELNNCPGARFAALYIAIEAVQGDVVAYLTQLMANLAPVKQVETAISLPSLVAAWKLYQDPTRAVDLALRNGVRHPSFMPLQFEALAPGYPAPGIPTAWPATPL